MHIETDCKSYVKLLMPLVDIKWNKYLVNCQVKTLKSQLSSTSWPTPPQVYLPLASPWSVAVAGVLVCKSGSRCGPLVGWLPGGVVLPILVNWWQVSWFLVSSVGNILINFCCFWLLWLTWSRGVNWGSQVPNLMLSAVLILISYNIRD